MTITIISIISVVFEKLNIYKNDSTFITKGTDVVVNLWEVTLLTKQNAYL